MLLLQLGALQQLTRIPPEIVPHLSLSLPLELALALAWALIFAWLAVNLWRGAQTCRLWQALALYAVVSALRLLLFARADYDRGPAALPVAHPAAGCVPPAPPPDKKPTGVVNMTAKPEGNPGIDLLRSRRALGQLGGGEERIRRQHDTGRQTARERLDILLRLRQLP